MKRKSLFLNITVLFLTVAGCRPDAGPQKAHETADNKGLKNQAAIDNRVSIALEPNPINISKAGHAELIITNGTTDPLRLGERFYIESFNGKQWKALHVLDSISFNDVGYIIPPGRVKVLSVNLRPKPFDYWAGRYRIGITVQTLPGDRKLDLKTTFLMQ